MQLENLGSETLGQDLPIDVSVQAGIRYNNYQGYGYNAGLNLVLLNGLGAGISIDNGETNYSYNINPFAILEFFTGNNNKTNNSNRASSKASEEDGKLSDIISGNCDRPISFV